MLDKTKLSKQSKKWVGLETLWASERKYRQLFEKSTDAIFIVEKATGRYLAANAAAEKLTGYSEAQIKQLTTRDLTPEGADHRLKQANAKDVATQFGEVEYLRPDGTKRIAKLSMVPLDDKTVYGIAHDITARKRMEQALQESELKFKNIVNSSPMGIYLYELKDDGRLVFVDGNPASDRIVGVAHRQFIGKTNEEVFPGLVGTELPARYREAALNGTLWRSEQIDYDDGAISGAYEIIVFQIEPRKIAVLFDEITSRKQTEVALKKSERRFRDLAEMLPEAVFETDADLTLNYANKQALTLFGYSKQDIKNGLNGLDVIAPKDRQRAREAVGRLFIGKGTRAAEYQGIRKDGSTFPMLLHPRAITDQDKIDGLRGIVIDMTERKRFEEQLQQAQKMESIGTLAGGIAHDFNNILFPIIALSELLLAEAPAESTLYANLQEILKAGQRGSDLVKQILAFSRQSKQQLIPVRIQQVLNEALKLCRSTIPSNIGMHEDIQTDCGPVKADPTQLHQIVMNLITNAYHAMETTGGKLHVRLQQVNLKSAPSQISVLPPGEYARLTVSDTGTGIAPDMVQKIFDPYFTTKEIGKGTGLGLSVVQGIVKSYHGDIRLTSSPGKGAQFDIYLPIQPQKEATQRPSDPGPVRGGSEKLLLVDDEEAIVRIEQQALERLGYRVVTRTGSVDALEAFKANADSFDLIVTDMAMPNMTGIQLAEKVKAIRPSIPIILCTGFSSQVDEDKCRSIGIEGFVMKPVLIQDIAKTIRRVLEK